jgi:hypothetical protein
MQIVSLILDHYNFYSPSTGGVILDGEVCHENEPSLLGYWLDEFWQEPHINDNFLDEKWQEYISNYDALCAQENFVNEFRSLEDFFTSLKIDNLIVFKITDKLPSTPTAYFIIDMSIC